VTLHDNIAPNAEASLRKFVETAWPSLELLGLSPEGVGNDGKSYRDTLPRRSATS